MNDIDYYRRAISIRKRSERAALATIIKTKGSTPRKVGTKMIVYADGGIEGTIGGGCGEGEVIEKSFSIIKSGIPAIHQVDLTEGLFYEDGGICGGIMDVYIEPIQ